MSSLAAALSTALTGLQVSTAQMQLTSNNIANAQSPGFAAKSVTLSPIVNGTDVGGVDIASYNRATNVALTTSYNNSTSDASFQNTQNGYIKQVQALLGSTINPPPLENAISTFQSAWTQFQSAPENTIQQEAVIQAGSGVATQVQTISSGVITLTNEITADINIGLSTLNTDLNQIVSLNQQIHSAGPTSAAAGNFEDQRDLLINQIASVTNITVQPRADGQIALYSPSGVLMLDGSTQAENFTYNGVDVVASNGQIVTNALTGGSLQAQLQFIAPAAVGNVSSSPGNQVLSKLSSQMAMLANAFTDTTNPTSFESAYDNATTGAGELASGFFQVNTLPSGLPDPTSFSVNPSLLNGTSAVKQASGTAVVSALATNQTFPPAAPAGLGLGLPANSNGTYADMGNAVLGYFQQAANSLSSSSQSATQQQGYYQQAVANATGVNVDSELIALTTLQNSYAASAHVISTVNQMFTDLINILQ